jgi:hypothetical protein
MLAVDAKSFRRVFDLLTQKWLTPDFREAKKEVIKRVWTPFEVRTHKLLYRQIGKLGGFS